MAQPQAYNREVDFTERDGDDTNHAGINAELDAAALSINQIRDNLALIQRDDGALQNGIVTAESLAPSAFDAVLANVNEAVQEAQTAAGSATLAATTAIDARDDAQAAQAAAETASNAASLNAATAATKAAEADASATSAATSASTATTKASEASTSATNAATSATAAAGSATSAGTSATNAAASATAAATSAANAATSASTATTQAGIATTAATAAVESFDQFDDRYLGSKTSDPTTDNDGNPLLTGALYFNSVAGEMRVWAGTFWKATGSAVGGTINTAKYTATAGQTTFAIVYDVGFVHVYLNGLKLESGVDFTANNGTSVVLATGATAGDVVDMIAFGIFSVANTYTKAELNAPNGSTLVGFEQSGTGAVQRTVQTKLLEIPSQIDYINLAQAIASNYNGVLKLKSGSVIDLPSSPITITSPIIIEADGEGSVLLRKTANVDALRLYSPYIKIRGIKVFGSVDGALGFTDTTDGIVIGRNDGANGQNIANGYINAIECELKDVIVEKCGRDNVSWQEGAFLNLNNVHCLSAGRRNFEVSDKSFDASHGVWFTASAGAVGDGYSIKWGVHHFVIAKSFADGGRGVYINQSRGSTGNVFVELSGGACLEFGPDTLANNINLQFWSTGKNYVDNGIGNKITGMSLGNNNGAAFETFTRTNKLLVKNEHVPSGGTVRNGGFLLEQTSDNDFEMGDAAYACKVAAKGGGVLFKNIAIGHKVFDLTGFGSTIDLNTGNQHIDNWLLSSGQTLRINGASGTGYTPYDGQTITIWLKGVGTASIYGWIAGALQTITITETNTSKTLMWQAAQGYWFVKT